MGKRCSACKFFKRMTLKQKYPDYKLVHFIEMYDDVVGIESHVLNTVIFEDRDYIISILEEIKAIELKKEEYLVEDFMNSCGWINENEKSVERIKKELESIKDLQVCSK